MTDWMTKTRDVHQQQLVNLTEACDRSLRTTIKSLFVGQHFWNASRGSLGCLAQGELRVRVRRYGASSGASQATLAADLTRATPLYLRLLDSKAEMEYPRVIWYQVCDSDALAVYLVTS